ncbi:MAG: sel1 repeat family protein [Rhodospirillales bacterium]|nr:MAG: sel1 repeat family protein [Rhodospirillales bacterium]
MSRRGAERSASSWRPARQDHRHTRDRTLFAPEDHLDAAPCEVADERLQGGRPSSAALTFAGLAIVAVVYLAGLPAIQAPAAEASATATTVSVATGDGGGAGAPGAAVVDVLAQADGPSRTEEPAQRGATEGPTASTGPERFVMPAPPGDSPIGRPWQAATAAAYEAARAAAQTTAAGEPATAPVIETPHQPEPAVPELEAAEPLPEDASADEPAAGGLAVTALLDRGNAMLELGDVASARLFFRRAADAGSGQGALLMGVTYDPVTFSRLGITGTRPHPRDAVTWYRTAQSLGVTEADSRLSALRRWLVMRAGEGDAEAAAILELLP